MASIANPASSSVRWRDGKRYLWLASPALPVIVLLALASVPLTGSTVLCWIGPVLFYVIAPLLDWFIGTDVVNAPETAVQQLEDDRYYRAIVFAYIPAQFLVTGLGAWLAMTQNLNLVQLVGVLISTGMINGVGINTAHELGHKKEALERWLAKLTLAPVAYGHFFVEHNKGHHKHVATPEDPASSRMGENFWAFLPRTMIGSIRSAWRIERERLERLGKPVLSLGNENIQAWAMTVLFFGALTVWLGWPALAFLVVQAFFGASLLEVVNYLEHYGLSRKKLADGRYERCAPEHSWNSNHVVTNLLLYQLQRHSDHHANPTRRYQALRHFEQSPQLPTGYGSLLFVAYIPWLWYRLMDGRVAAHYGYDLTRARIEPSKREALMRRWHRPASASTAPAAEVLAPVATLQPEPAIADVGEGRAYSCPNCRFVYAESRGCPNEGWAAGTRWSELPTAWTCPQCAVREKPDFVRIA